MSSVQKLGVSVLFFTITTVHGSLKSSREQGKREPANSAKSQKVFKKRDFYLSVKKGFLCANDDFYLRLSSLQFIVLTKLKNLLFLVEPYT